VNGDNLQYSDTQLSSTGKDIARGFGLTFLLHLIQLPMGLILGFLPLLVIGVSQIVYIIPAMIVVSSKGHSRMAIGLLLGAAVTFLLNGVLIGVACAALLKSFH